MANEFTDFPIEFHVEPDLDDDTEKTLFVEAEDQMRKLAKNHTDITKVSVDITQPAEDRETPYIYQAKVVIYARPTTMAAEEKNKDVSAALRGALKAAARQIRDKRERLRNY
jgi:ribosome-associated translation inhibitor RaiA